MHLSNAGATRRAVELARRRAADDRRPTAVVNVGADLLRRRARGPGRRRHRVDWRPPMPGTEADLAAVAADPRRADANARALAADARR